MLTGLQVVLRDGCDPLLGRRVGLIANHTSVGSDFRPSYVHFQKTDGVELIRLFGPEHGIWGIAQDQEIVLGQRDEQTGLEIVSLYGGQLAPSPDMLRDLDVLVFDIQDIGTRYYTFIWTMLLSMKAAAAAGVEFIVLDRPNPLGGTRREGNLLDPAFASFVGLSPLPVVHGLTAGEIARFLNERDSVGCRLRVIACQGWHRDETFDRTGLPWIPPSPNMPALATAVVYPGTCLLEATNLSEGRGTTTPFEMIGAPWIDPWRWSRELDLLAIPGIAFRPLYFRPLTNKYAGLVCGGVFLQVINPKTFPAFLAGIAIIKTAHDLFPDHFSWKSPPYEFEMERMPIDLLTGTDMVRLGIDRGDSISSLTAGWGDALAAFDRAISPFMLYG